MRRRPLTLAAALLSAATILAAAPAAAAPERPEQQWREVFSADGTITPMLLPAERTGAQSADSRAAAAAAAVVAIQNTGPSSERFDLVIVGDGYTSSEMALLRQHAQAKWDTIAATAPWSTYRDSVNVWLVEVVSAQSGVDNDPTQGISKNTALDMYFWCGNIERLLCLNETKAKSYAAQAPAVDAIVAVGNTTKYGGAGYPSLATVSGGNAQAGQIAIHELGHSVGGLADEYWTAGTTYTGSEPSEPNVTKSSSCAKWASYAGRATPDGGVIGCFQGGHQYANGIYRPSQDSLMRTLGKPFNLVGLDVMDRAIRAKIGGGGTTCTGYQNTRTGSLSSGGSVYQPDGTYYYSAASGTHRACLDGPAGVEFNLQLQKWNGSAWATVATAATSGPDETLSYSGTAGYYTYLLQSASGAGSYTFAYSAP
ncbi:M64 family metallopeptidase [Catellatospora sp. KI3]|uniref:M64 family metallopeptidase n=1 Tax=Catellatospora sp. KI3 TaxID=3041620 RepID=UPI0024829812|nr:M64 family metallopeptidase [Catellatospora sp. KI3]MDI1461167.1 M64 family metallopeptidase [Catellatospora sp. KI3]